VSNVDELDPIDLQILKLLQEDGRISNTDLAHQVGLAPPTVLRRVKLLEERGYIRGYAALVDPISLGLTVTAFIFIESMACSDLPALGEFLAHLPGVQEVHRVVGEWCFLLKVRTQSPQTLETLIYGQLRSHPSIRRTFTTLATSSAYESPALPLPTPYEAEEAARRN
jgi:Lrp/AsnC family leucine-responsive transcriptional regulator